LGTVAAMTVWVMGCRHDHVGSTTDVPRIADDLLQCPSRQSRARSGNRNPQVVIGSSIRPTWRDDQRPARPLRLRARVSQPE